MNRAAQPRWDSSALSAFAFFLGLTVLMTWPQAAHLGDRLNDLWDAKQNAWILHWDFVQTFHDPANLFQAPIFHPARYALAFSENLYGGAVFGFPLLALGVPILVNYNVVFLFSMAFSAWAAWLLARYVTADALASLVAGLVFAFVPWRFAQLPHINMQFGGFLCLLFLFLLRYLDAGRRRDLVLFAVCFAWNLLATFHFGLFAGFLIAAVLLVEGVAGAAQRRRIPAVAAAAALATLACAPFLIPYLKAASLYGMRRSLEEMQAFSARPSDYLSAGARNRLYGVLTARWSRGEGDLFPGILPVLLAGAAVAGRLSRPPSRRRAVLLLLVGAVGVLVAAGARTPFYRLLFTHVGGPFQAIRVPSRAIVLSHAALGVLAAWGLSRLTRGLPRTARLAGVAAALAVVAFEYRAFPLALHPYAAAPRAVDGWLRAREGAGAVIEWPLGFPYDCEAMLRQAEHGKPLLNGHQSYAPPAYRRLVKAMSARPIAPEVWEELARLDAGTVMFHPDAGPVYDRVRYRPLLREGLAEGRIRPVRSFQGGDGPVFLFDLVHARAEDAAPAIGTDPAARRDLDALLAIPDAEVAPPTGVVHLPAEGQTVQPGFWVHGWAVDDSGIARVETASELGPTEPAAYGSRWPGLAEIFPDLSDGRNGGYGFPVPPLPPGPHTLRVTLVGRDGGRTLLERHIVVAAKP